MSRIGSINYLNFSPYQILPRYRNSLSLSSHWYLIQILTSIINLTSYGNSMDIYFTSENMVSNGWFKMYLNHSQLFYLKNTNNFELYPIEDKHKITRLNSFENQNCYVYASKDWIPPKGSQIISRVSSTLFLVKNLTINDSVKKDERILSIKPVPRKKLNNRYNSGFLQNHHQKSVYDHNIYAPIRSLHNRGLDGRGQVINIVDTGVDALNAMFYDPSNSLNSISGRTNPNHRKIIRIETYADNLDYHSGHGTHVAGIAAGSAFCADELCGIMQYNGIASGSKIYFSDIGHASITGDLSEEFDLEEQAKLLHSVDAHISSNSWSYDVPMKEDAFIYDKSAYNNPDLLYLFAAGNDYSYFSINSPSCAKNVVSVGATNTVSSSLAESSTQSVVVGNDTLSFTGNEITNSYIRLNGIAEKMSYIVNTSIAYYNSSVPEDFNEKVVLLNMNKGASNYEVCEAYFNVSANKAKAVIVPFSMVNRCSWNSCPFISTNDSDFNELLTMETMSILPYSGSDSANLPPVAALSSKGPSLTGISKPDFVVPGYNVISARSHGTSSDYRTKRDYYSNLVTMSGTSMATPAGSALATIVRQFLRDGFYPGLEKGSGDSITPSSCLIRAMIANSAVQYLSSGQSKYSTSGPSIEAGFGIPCLEKVFGYQGAALRLVDNVLMPSLAHHVYHVHLDNNSQDLSVSMVYLDPPLNPDNDANFFADLDLFIKSPTSVYYNGNGVNQFADSDSFSNSERVIVDKKDIPENGGDFEIHVISSEYPIDDQKVTYSLVVNGPFPQKDIEKNPLFLKATNGGPNDCINKCSSNGVCGSNGLCECNENTIGISCSTPINTVYDGSEFKGELVYKKVQYLKLAPKSASLNVNSVDFKFVYSTSRASVFICSSTEKTNPGKFTNAGWECSLVGQGIFSVELPYDDYKAVMLAIFESYFKPINFSLYDVQFVYKEKPVKEKSSKKALYIAGYTVCGVVLLTVIIALTVLIVKIIKKKKAPMTDLNEEIMPTVQENI